MEVIIIVFKSFNLMYLHEFLKYYSQLSLPVWLWRHAMFDFNPQERLPAGELKNVLFILFSWFADLHVNSEKILVLSVWSSLG